MRVITLIMCTHARAYITNNKLKLQISYARLIFLNEPAGELSVLLKMRKSKMAKVALYNAL